MIAEATMLSGRWLDEHPEYESQIQMRDNLSSREESGMLEEKIKINRVRRILGWKDIRL